MRPQVNAVGYCVGGTLLAATLAYLAEENKTPVASATFLAAQVDFAFAGDLKIFIDEGQIEVLETAMNARGYLDSSYMASTFNMLRANELIWPYFVNTYLRGQQPSALRPAVLEFGFNTHDACQSFFLFARMLSEKLAV